MTNLCETCRKQNRCNPKGRFKAYECDYYVNRVPGPVSIYQTDGSNLGAKAYNLHSERNEGYFFLKICRGSVLTFVQVLYTNFGGKVHITYMHETDTDDDAMKAFEIDLDPDKAYYIRIEDALICFMNSGWTWYNIIDR